MHRTEVIAVHGWGFDASCWGAWREAWLPPYRFQAAERGYFGEWPRAPRWAGPRDDFRVLLVHSMGLLFCSQDLLRGADVAVLFGCFLRFHPDGGAEEKRSRRVLGRMRRRLRSAPLRVLLEFRERAGMPLPATEDLRPNVDRLEEDLALLDRGRVAPDLLAEVGEAFVLYGEEDVIVSEKSARALQRALPEGAQFRSVPGATHALPFTHPRESRRCLGGTISFPPVRGGTATGPGVVEAGP